MGIVMHKNTGIKKTKTVRNSNPHYATEETKSERLLPSGIDRGSMSAGKVRGRMITIYDVAKKSGFAASTVSMVLSNAPLSRSFSTATKNRIKRTAEALGYCPNALARSLRKRQSHTVGVMLELASPHSGRILRGIEGVLYEASHLSILMGIHAMKGKNNSCWHSLVEQNVDGLIALAIPGFANPDLFAGLEEARIPVVIVGSPLERGSIPCAAVDEESGAYTALRHIYSLGHREIAFIRGSESAPGSGRSWGGVCRFAKERGLRLDSGVIADSPASHCANGGFRAGYELSRDFLRRRRRFTALVTHDDLIAHGAIRALSESGIRVPEQCSVLALDESARAGFDSPPLTVLRYPGETLGAIAADLLLQKVRAIREKAQTSGLSGKITSEMVVWVAPELVIRKSTGPVSGPGSNIGPQPTAEAA